jgi:hypothetical protein
MYGMDTYFRKNLLLKMFSGHTFIIFHCVKPRLIKVDSHVGSVPAVETIFHPKKVAKTNKKLFFTEIY